MRPLLALSIIAYYTKRARSAAHFRIQALESLWNKISNSLTPDPEWKWCEEMSAHSLPIEFSRFVFENKPTLPCFMSDNKYMNFPKHIALLSLKITALKSPLTYRVSAEFPEAAAFAAH